MNLSTIRPLTPEDAAEFQRVRLAALREAPEAFGSSYEEESVDTIAQWRARLAPREGYVLLGAFVDGALAGVGGVARGHTMKQRHKAEIWGIYVVPAQRRGGLARQLTEALLARAARMTGVRHVLLSVGADNGAAHALYASLGFAEYGREPDAMLVGGRLLANILMIRPLAAR
ncbi:GNAT family N-acetyltransferase [Bordetella parapertussis]|uniref:Acetyltransferase n=4 Tax=Bordetella TaxID=517 RepID=K0MAQ1_BORPB|nr:MULTISPECIES: GNAT family N-acetyltransferase [Bordetella]KAK66713.1 FR47-like protein [Bordetella bronchiseptica 980-2]KCV29303.1 FR47-like protein [Bordetella bronchiseptica 00-P-2730]AMG87350.1 N-acetyltransferase [Bordetella bronchiseptica]AOB38070.1 acetyltransferase [Bordetella parapertussis]AUL42039.1 GNAT family N-acetyltransferase [Bordetella parapertussis]